MKKERGIAIVLAAGQGRRMNSKVQKQYLMLQGHPVLYYSLRAFQEADEVEEIILVTGSEEIEYCRKEIVERYSFTKVSRITAGGKERYHSVYEGIRAAEQQLQQKYRDGADKLPVYLFIHDGARPFLSQEIIRRTLQDACTYRACVAAMPVKDTIKVSDENRMAVHTPDRNLLWQIQTPQVFEYSLVKEAYDRLMEHERETPAVTDDAMVVELMCGVRPRLTEGSYRNIKITTPEDLETAEVWADNFFTNDSKK